MVVVDDLAVNLDPLGHLDLRKLGSHFGLFNQVDSFPSHAELKKNERDFCHYDVEHQTLNNFIWSKLNDRFFGKSFVTHS